MSERRAVTPRLLATLAVVPLWSALLTMMPLVHAQDGTQGAPYPVRIPGEVGDGWIISVEAATLNARPFNDGPPDGQLMLMATLQVRNAAPEPRYFPIYRLHVVTGSGIPQRDTWCGRNSNPLEVTREISPNGIQTGSMCWVIGSADVSSVMMYMDPPAREGGRQASFFALTPIVSAVDRVVPTLAPTSPSLLVDSPAPVANHTVPSATDSPRSQCSTAYSMYADAHGGYLTSGCSAGSSSSGGASIVQQAAGAPACQLYPSAKQPTSSTSANSSTDPRVAPTPVPAPATASQGALNGERC
jgi:hypothetical protein